MALVFSDEAKAPGDRVFLPVERLIYRICRVDPDREQRWTVYAYSLFAFSFVSFLVVYALQRLQGSLPFNPVDVSGVIPHLSFNTAVSFMTNTNWQSYGGETTMSHLTQMVGLSVQNFVSAAAGMAVMAAFIRGLARRRASTLGNFWVDLTRTTVRILLPLAFVLAIVLVSQGVIQNFHGHTEVTTLEGGTQLIPGGPAASQVAIKQFGTNGGGFFNVNSAHPFENSTTFNNFLETWAILVIPFAHTLKVPVDAVTASASGLDPNISVANARLQAARVAQTRGLEVQAVLRLIDAHTTDRALGFLGEKVVNLLNLNLALDDAQG
jgi:K+-transporting ATPase ATPase A chain